MRWSLRLLSLLLCGGLVSGDALPLRQNPRPDAAGQEGVRLTTLVVSLPVVVQDRQGRFITDLKREDFHVFDNGVEQPVAHFASLEEAEELGAFIYTVKYPDLRQHAGQDFEPDRDYGAFPRDWVEKWVYLEDLAKRSGGRFYRVVSMKRVLTAFASIAEELRHQYSLGYYPQPLPGPGEERRLQVKVGRDNLSVRTRKRYVFDAAAKAH